MMLGYGGMVSLGHAAYLGIAGYACILLVIAGYDQLTAAILAVAFSTACAALVRRAVAARAGPRLHHDHARARPDRLGHRLSRQRPHRRRQRHPPSGAARCRSASTSRDAPSFYYFTLIVFAIALFCIWRFSRSPFGASLMGTRDQPRRMSHARPQCLAGAVADLRDGRLLGLGRGHALRLLQPVPEPARDLAAAIGRNPADGDPRRRQHAHRADRRRRHHHAGEERGLAPMSSAGTRCSA